MGQVRDTTERRRRIEANLPLVRALALRFARRGGEPLDDLVQAGCIGLIHAVDRFDPGRGAFESFAVPTITGEIRNHLRDRGGIIRAPADWSPQIAPIAEDDAPLADPIPGAEDRIAVAAALRTLPLHERRVVVLWLYGGRSQRRIAAEVGLSQIHVSRLLRRALERLRPRWGTDRLPVRLQRRRFASVAEAADYAMVLTHAANGDGPVWTATWRSCPAARPTGRPPRRAAAAAPTRWRAGSAAAEAEGREMPPPGAAAAHSGKLLVRMPRSLHAELIRASEREGTSLNAYIVAALAASVAWRRPAAPPSAAPPARPAVARARDQPRRPAARRADRDRAARRGWAN